MSLGILGNKIGMTQIFDKFGNIIPVTVIRVGPCIVTQIKTISVDGYNAIQLGYLSVKPKVLTQSQIGHLHKSNIKSLKYLKEYLIDNPKDFNLGQIININSFKIGQLINVRGKTSGKGFTGLQKRHNFSKGPMSHGSKNHRAPGSIGMGTSPGRVLPGKKMSGHLGNTQKTIKNLEIIQINIDYNILVVKGSIPGKPGNLINITK